MVMAGPGFPNIHAMDRKALEKFAQERAERLYHALRQIESLTRANLSVAGVYRIKDKDTYIEQIVSIHNSPTGLIIKIA